MPKLMMQQAPYPHELAELIDDAKAFPGWYFELYEEDRGQGCAGLTMEIIVRGPNAYHPDDKIGVRHLFVVPAAGYNRKSWQAWIRERCMDVLGHETGEWLRFGDERPFKPNHGDGHDPYFVYVVSTEAEAAERPGAASKQ